METSEYVGPYFSVSLKNYTVEDRTSIESLPGIQRTSGGVFKKDHVVGMLRIRQDGVITFKLNHPSLPFTPDGPGIIIEMEPDPDPKQRDARPYTLYFVTDEDWGYVDDEEIYSTAWPEEKDDILETVVYAIIGHYGLLSEPKTTAMWKMAEVATISDPRLN